MFRDLSIIECDFAESSSVSSKENSFNVLMKSWQGSWPLYVKIGMFKVTTTLWIMLFLIFKVTYACNYFLTFQLHIVLFSVNVKCILCLVIFTIFFIIYLQNVQVPSKLWNVLQYIDYLIDHARKALIWSFSTYNLWWCFQWRAAKRIRQALGKGDRKVC